MNINDISNSIEIVIKISIAIESMILILIGSVIDTANVGCDRDRDRESYRSLCRSYL